MRDQMQKWGIDVSGRSMLALGAVIGGMVVFTLVTFPKIYSTVDLRKHLDAYDVQCRKAGSGSSYSCERCVAVLMELKQRGDRHWHYCQSPMR
mgnify:CR=1 FL=1